MVFVFVFVFVVLLQVVSFSGSIKITVSTQRVFSLTGVRYASVPSTFSTQCDIPHSP